VGIETLPIPGRRDLKKQQTRSALMTGALRLVDERGVDRVTVEDISAAAGVSPRTFFNYFATKDEALIGDPLADGVALIEALRAVDPAIPALGAILLALAPAIEQIQADRDLWLLRMRVIAGNPSLLPALFARGIAAEQQFIAAIAERTGFAPDDAYPPVVATVTGAAFRSAMIRWAAADGSQRLTDFVHQAFGLLATGLAEPPKEWLRLEEPPPPEPKERLPLEEPLPPEELPPEEPPHPLEELAEEVVK
jgi:AcrR family transcriptional regulator